MLAIMLLCHPAGQRAVLAEPHVRYRIVALGALPAAGADAAPGLSEDGRVAAWTEDLPDRTYGYMWKGGSRHRLPGLVGYPAAFPRAINARGEAAGVARIPAETNRGRAFVTRGDHVEDLGTLGGAFAEANAINEAGVVAGAAAVASGKPHAFRWRAGRMEDLGVLPGGSFSVARGENDAGDIVGIGDAVANGQTHALLFHEGRIVDLGLLPGGGFAAARSINAQGDVAGYAATAEGETHACLFQRGGCTDLGSLGNDPSAAWGINRQGDVVGSAANLTKRMHAFLWQGGTMRDLNNLIPAGSGWTLQVAYRINDRGEILAAGRHAGRREACLLEPLTNATGRARPERGPYGALWRSRLVSGNGRCSRRAVPALRIAHADEAPVQAGADERVGQSHE